MSGVMYAEFAKKRYIADLEKEAEAALENISEASELLEKDVWHRDASLQLEANMSLFKQLRVEISKVDGMDPDEWWRAVREAS